MIMNPREKGWLKEYLEFRKELFKQITHQAKASHPEQSLYRLMQPTGLMYGQSIANFEHPAALDWDDQDKMKILLAECLVSGSMLYHSEPVDSAEDLSKAFTRALENIGNFYNKIFPELSTPSKTLFGRKRSPLEVAEKILEKRVARSANLKDNFWASLFHNSLLFLDVFIFGQWIHTNADKIVTDFFRYERDELRFSVLKVMAASAHSDNVLHYEEQKLFEYFIQGIDLVSEKKKEAIQIFGEGISLEEINLPSENSWILKKFFLEVAILTAWADRRIEEAEQEFLRNFCKYLGFSDDDLENSLIAVEGFVLEHWEQLEYLQDKQDYKSISEHFIGRMAHVASKNIGRLHKELDENSSLKTLLEKAQKQELTPEESHEVRESLIQLLKTIPAFVIIALPHRFLTLPVLLKILPKELFGNP